MSNFILNNKGISILNMTPFEKKRLFSNSNMNSILSEHSHIKSEKCGSNPRLFYYKYAVLIFSTHTEIQRVLLPSEI